jgi:hypothetical protein
MHFRIILIGLSGLLTGCGIFSIDPPTDWLDVDFQNDTDNQILIKFIPDSSVTIDYYFSDSLIILEKNVTNHRSFVDDKDYEMNLENTVEGYSSFSIELYQSDSLVKVWDGPSGYFGDSIHSPFNYDSWEIKPVDDRGPNTVSAITFTITEEDFK